MKRTGANNVDRRPFCGVCQKAGKPESMYRGHYTKTKPGADGIVVCPTILSIECRFCHEKGHIASEDHCPALREKKYQREQYEREDREKERYAKKQKEAEGEESKKRQIDRSRSRSIMTANNRFATAFCDSDDDDDDCVDKKRKISRMVSVPSSSVPIVAPKPVAETVRTFSYASMLKREAPVEDVSTKTSILTHLASTNVVAIKFVQEPEPEKTRDMMSSSKMDTKYKKKLEAIKKYYTPIPLDTEHQEELDEFEYDPNFMSKKYVSNDAW